MLNRIYSFLPSTERASSLFPSGSAIRPILAVAGIVGFSRPVLAHPGHQVEVVPADSSLHHLFQPEHAIVYLLVLVAAVVLCGMLKKRSHLDLQAIPDRNPSCRDR